MSKIITLALKKSLIVEAVKADTFQSGQLDKAADPVKNAGMAYNEQAGNETFHERKIMRFLRSGLAKFAAVMNEFVDTEAGSLSYTFSDQSDDIIIKIAVSTRYNDGLAQPLSSIAEEYITYIVDYMWWQPMKPEMAKDYLSYAQEALSFIRLCLAKTAPKASSADYTDVTGYVNGGSPAATHILATIDYNDQDGGFKFLASTLISNFISQQNISYRCTDPSASFALKVEGSSEAIISGLGDQHAFTSSEIMTIQVAIDGIANANLVLTPLTTVDASNKLIISYSD